MHNPFNFDFSPSKTLEGGEKFARAQLQAKQLKASILAGTGIAYNVRENTANAHHIAEQATYKVFATADGKVKDGRFFIATLAQAMMMLSRSLEGKPIVEVKFRGAQQGESVFFDEHRFFFKAYFEPSTAAETALNTVLYLNAQLGLSQFDGVEDLESSIAPRFYTATPAPQAQIIMPVSTVVSPGAPAVLPLVQVAPVDPEAATPTPSSTTATGVAPTSATSASAVSATSATSAASATVSASASTSAAAATSATAAVVSGGSSTSATGVTSATEPVSATSSAADSATVATSASATVTSGGSVSSSTDATSATSAVSATSATDSATSAATSSAPVSSTETAPAASATSAADSTSATSAASATSATDAGSATSATSATSA